MGIAVVGVTLAFLVPWLTLAGVDDAARPVADVGDRATPPGRVTVPPTTSRVLVDSERVDPRRAAVLRALVGLLLLQSK